MVFLLSLRKKCRKLDRSSVLLANLLRQVCHIGSRVKSETFLPCKTVLDRVTINKRAFHRRHVLNRRPLLCSLLPLPLNSLPSIACQEWPLSTSDSEGFDASERISSECVVLEKESADASTLASVIWQQLEQAERRV